MSRHRALISSPIVSGLLCRFNYSDWSLRCAVVKQVRVYSSTYANADRNQDEGIGWITILLSHKNAAEHFIHTCNPTMHTNQPNGACKQTKKRPSKHTPTRSGAISAFVRVFLAARTRETFIDKVSFLCPTFFSYTVVNKIKIIASLSLQRSCFFSFLFNATRIYARTEHIRPDV